MTNGWIGKDKLEIEHRHKIIVKIGELVVEDEKQT